jgi:hypothetical protein
VRILIAEDERMLADSLAEGLRNELSEHLVHGVQNALLNPLFLKSHRCLRVRPFDAGAAVEYSCGEPIIPLSSPGAQYGEG